MRERARLVGEPQGIGMAQAFLSILLNDPARRRRRVLGRGSEPDLTRRPGSEGPTLRRIAGFFKPYRARLAFIAVLILITVSIGVVNPILLEAGHRQPVRAASRTSGSSSSSAG